MEHLQLILICPRSAIFNAKVLCTSLRIRPEQPHNCHLKAFTCSLFFTYLSCFSGSIIHLSVSITTWDLQSIWEQFSEGKVARFTAF